MTPEREPTLRQVRDELKADLKHDERLRAVEVEQAVTRTSLDGLRHQMQTSEDRLLAAISELKRPIWPAVSAIVAAVALILVVAQALYGS